MQQPLTRALGVVILALTATGCIGDRIIYPVMPTPAQLAEFESAGPVKLEADPDGLVAMHVSGGAYKIIAGDLLEVEVPQELAGGTTDGEESTKLRSRVSEAGTIKLPQVGELEVAGLTEPEIEEKVVNAYHPTYTSERPNVVVEVAKHKTETVAVLGSVASPGIHDLRSDRLSLLGALMTAGGISSDKGARAIRILRPDEEGGDPQVMPVRDQNIPFSDILLVGGETIIVEPAEEKQFTIRGLVRKPGAYPYPQHRTYNLMQAIALSGGTDETAAPRFASIYRKRENGELIACTFKIDGLSLTDASNIVIKPGDVVAVEHTQGSWTRSLINQIFGFSFNVSSSQSQDL